MKIVRFWTKPISKDSLFCKNLLERWGACGLSINCAGKLKHHRIYRLFSEFKSEKQTLQGKLKTLDSRMLRHVNLAL